MKAMPAAHVGGEIVQGIQGKAATDKASFRLYDFGILSPQPVWNCLRF